MTGDGRRAVEIAGAHWRGLAVVTAEPIHSGLINATFLIRDPEGGTAILQRLHPVFPPQVNEDIQAVTSHLSARGMTTPHLLPTDQGRLWVEADDGVWRALEYLPGVVYQRLTDPARALEAGRLVGRFHRALGDLEHVYRSVRGQVHDTPAHLKRLAEALVRHQGHRLYERVAPRAETLLRGGERLVDLRALPLRHAHGHLKISNLMFDANGQGLCLIDLDTLARMHWPLEMGDALRSWCNPNREDQQPARLDLDLFRSAVWGYRQAAGDFITREEWEALVPGLSRICLELAARFLADALNENYFGWDPGRYPRRGEHNLTRGLAMWSLYLDTLAQAPEAWRWVRAAG